MAAIMDYAQKIAEAFILVWLDTICNDWAKYQFHSIFVWVKVVFGLIPMYYS